MQSSPINNNLKMLTIKETAETGILTQSALRRFVKQGKVPGIYVGRKFLINFNKLYEMLNNGTIESNGN